MAVDRAAELSLADNGFDEFLGLEVALIGGVDHGALGCGVSLVSEEEVITEISICLAELTELFIFGEEVKSKG